LFPSHDQQLEEGGVDLKNIELELDELCLVVNFYANYQPKTACISYTDNMMHLEDDKQEELSDISIYKAEFYYEDLHEFNLSDKQIEEVSRYVLIEC
jgi:hypothetical protein